MNILTKLTIKNLLLNKKRAIGTMIGIILSVALICAVLGMFTSFRQTLLENSINSSGYYHIAINKIDEQNINTYRLNKDVKNVYLTYVLGSSRYIKDNDDISLNVYSIEKNDFDNLAYKIQTGNFPTNSKEVLISEYFQKMTNLNIGDEIELEVSSKDTKTLKKYKIVGTFYRRKNSASNLLVTTDEKSDDIWAYISLNNPYDYKQSFCELLNVDEYSLVQMGDISNIEYKINNELLRWEVFAFSDNTISMFLMIIIVIITIILIVSVFCIRNSFAISTTEKMKLYGMLSSVGATKKQIKNSVIKEGLILGILGIPLGILCGILAVYILVQVVNLLLGDFLFNNIDGLVFKISIMSILVASLLGLITIYLSCIFSAKRASRVSPIDNLRNNQDIKINSKKLKVPKIIQYIFKTGGVLAYKNLKRSKKKYRTTVISITVSVFVFISMFYFINVGFEQAGMYYTDYKYDILIYLGRDYQTDKLQSLRNLEGINQSYLLYQSSNFESILDKNKVNYYEDDDIDHSVGTTVVALDNNSFLEYTKRLNLKYENVLDKAILVNEYRYYSTQLKKERIADRYNYKKGDLINLKYEDENKTQHIKTFELSNVTYEAPIGLENTYFDGGFIVLNRDYYSDLSFYPNYLLISTNDDIELQKKIEEIDNTVSVNNLKESARVERAMVIVISIFLYGFIIVISLIGVTNIFNTLTSNMELRQKEFAMLKSIGMTNKEFKRMINLETLFYSTKSLLFGIFFGLLGSYLLHIGFNLHTVRDFDIPYKGILISIVFVFLMVYIIMRYSMKKINRQNTIETIRKDNI